MRLRLRQILSGEVVLALRASGYDIVKIGEAPYWMERVTSLPAELYRMKEMVD